MAAAPSHSLPFISWNEGARKFVVNEEGARYLATFEDKIAVVIVAGRYRSGKSFLMNQLVGDAGGFAVGHTVESKTKGIWLCREAVKATTSTGEPVSMIFMDSEGLGASDKNVKHDTTVFSLAALLCSTLIFNGSSAINEESIQNLGFIANLTHHIRVRSTHAGSAAGGASEDTVEDFNRFFPSFLWVLRDFGLALVDDEGSVVSADDYMEDALEEQSGFDKETLARNRIRKCVKSYFRERHCFTLVRPIEDESALQELDAQPPSALRHEFRESMNVLRSFVLQNARPKELGGRFVNGAMLVQLARSYVDAINGGGMPSIADAWESAAAVQCSRALAAGWDAYSAAMQSTVSLPMDEPVLLGAHEAALDSANVAFDRAAPSGADSAVEKHRLQLQARAAEAFSSTKRDNITTSASQCGRIIRELSTSRIRPIVDALLAEAEQCSSAARALENDVVQYVSQRSDEGRGEDTLVASVDFSTRCNALPTLSHAVAQSRLLGTWTEAITSYLATAKGPSVRPTLQAEGFELLEDASKTVTASLDDTAAARQRTSNAIEALSRAVARDAIAHQQRTAADLLEARSTAAALTGQLAQATSSLAALSTEIAAVQQERMALGSALDESRAEVSNLKGELRAAGNREVSLADSLALNKAALDETRSALADASAREAAAATRVKELSAALNAAQESLETAQLAEKSTVADLAAVRADAAAAQRATAVATMERDKLRIQLDSAADDIERLQASVDKLRAERADLMRQVDAASVAAADVSQQRRRDQAVEAALRSELSALRTELASAQVAEQEAIESREAALLQAKTAQDELSRTALEAQESASAENRSEVASLQAQLAELSAHVATLVHDSAHTAAAHAADIANAESAFQAAQIDLQASKAIADELESDLREEKAARGLAEADLAKATEALASTTKRLADAKADLDALVAAHERLSAERAVLVAENAARRGEVDSLNSKAIESATRISELELALSAATATAEALGCEFQDLQTRLEEANAAAQQAQDAAAASERALAAERRSAQLGVAELTATAGSSSTLAADLLKKVSVLETQVVVLKAEAEDVTRERGILAQQLDAKITELQRTSTELASLRVAEGVANAAASDATARAAELNAALEVVGLELGACKQRQMEAEAAAAAAVAQSLALTESVAEWRARAEEASKNVERLASEVSVLEAAAAEVGPKGKYGKGSVEGLRASKVESERILEKIAGDLRETTAARDAAFATVAESQRIIASLKEDIAESARRIEAATAARDAAVAALVTSHDEADATKKRLREALDEASAAAAASADSIAALKLRVTVAEDDASAARSGRGALEKALRSANAELADARAKIEELATALSQGTVERELEHEKVLGARTDRDVITTAAEETVRQRDMIINKMREAQRQLQIKERRRAEVDTAVEVVRAGAEVTKYKVVRSRLGGSRVSVEQRWIVVLPLTTVAPGVHLPAVTASTLPLGTDGANLTVDALCWREVTRRKTFSKAIRFADIAAVVLGTRSPVFERVIKDGHGAALDAMRCFSVLVRPGGSVVADGGRAVLQPKGASFDFELSSPAECALWVYALRCLQLRSLGYGLYSLSRLVVKFERIGFKIQQLAEREFMTPRKYIDRLRDLARLQAPHSRSDTQNPPAIGIAGEAGPGKHHTADGASAAPSSTALDQSATANASTTSTEVPLKPLSAALRAAAAPTSTKSSLQSGGPSAQVIPPRVESHRGPGADVDSDDDASSAARAALFSKDSRAPPKEVAEAQRPVLPSSLTPPVANSSPVSAKPATRAAARATGGSGAAGATGLSAARADLFAGRKPAAEYVAPGTYAERRRKELGADKQPSQAQREADLAASLGVVAPIPAPVQAVASAVPVDSSAAAAPAETASAVQSSVAPLPAMSSFAASLHNRRALNDSDDDAPPPAPPTTALLSSSQKLPIAVEVSHGKAAGAKQDSDSDNDASVSVRAALFSKKEARAPPQASAAKSSARWRDDDDDDDASAKKQASLFSTKSSRPAAAALPHSDNEAEEKEEKGASDVAAVHAVKPPSSAPSLKQQQAPGGAAEGPRARKEGPHVQFYRDSDEDDDDDEDAARAVRRAVRARGKHESEVLESAPPLESEGKLADKPSAGPGPAGRSSVSSSPVLTPDAMPAAVAREGDEGDVDMGGLIADVEGMAHEVDASIKTDYHWLLAQQRAEREAAVKAQADEKRAREAAAAHPHGGGGILSLLGRHPPAPAPTPAPAPLPKAVVSEQIRQVTAEAAAISTSLVAPKRPSHDSDDDDATEAAHARPRAAAVAVSARAVRPSSRAPSTKAVEAEDSPSVGPSVDEASHAKAAFSGKPAPAPVAGGSSSGGLLGTLFGFAGAAPKAPAPAPGPASVPKPATAVPAPKPSMPRTQTGKPPATAAPPVRRSVLGDDDEDDDDDRDAVALARQRASHRALVRGHATAAPAARTGEPDRPRLPPASAASGSSRNPFLSKPSPAPPAAASADDAASDHDRGSRGDGSGGGGGGETAGADAEGRHADPPPPSERGASDERGSAGRPPAPPPAAAPARGPESKPSAAASAAGFVGSDDEDEEDDEGSPRFALFAAAARRGSSASATPAASGSIPPPSAITPSASAGVARSRVSRFNR